MKVYIIRSWQADFNDYGEFECNNPPKEEPAYFRTLEFAEEMESLLNDDYNSMGITFDIIVKDVSNAPYLFMEDVLGNSPSVEGFRNYVLTRK